VEALGAMTPEDLEALPGVDPAAVERIQAAVNSYYGQFEGAVESATATAEPALEQSTTATAEAAPEQSGTASENESVTITDAEVTE